MYDLHSILIQLKKEDTPLHGIMVRCVHCFYQRLTHALREDPALFELWEQELELIYGDLHQRLSQNAKTDAGDLGDQFGFNAPPELPRLLQSIQTFYSVLIKLIAWNTLRDASLEPPLTELLSGRAFVDRGIRNFCGDDWYIWPLDVWDPALEAQCEELWACLGSFDTCPEGSTHSPDSLSRIYETVVPPALRHALGEYYTPGWLAERTLQNAVSASGQRAGELRFLDPACGSGVFLIQALRLIRADTPKSPPLSDQVAGFDLHPLAVLTAKANYLAVVARQPLPEAGLFLPIYRYDALNVPIFQENTLVVDTGCGPVYSVPLSLCRQAVEIQPDPEEFLSMPEASRLFAPLPPAGRRLLAGILLDRIFAFFHQRADIVMGNPPWVNWEYLSPRYRAGSQHLWGEYGLLQVKGPRLGFSKEDVSTLFTCAALDRFLVPGGHLSFILRQATFRSAQNGAGFRRFHLDSPDLDFRVLEVEDLGRIRPFDGICTPVALVLIQRDARHVFPVPYRHWQAKPGFRRAVRSLDATISSVLPFVRMEDMTAAPAHREDPGSVWVSAPNGLAPVLDALLGSNPYQARTGVFTGGANAVYQLQILERAGSALRIVNLAEKARRKAPAVTTQLEPTCVYPLIQGSDLSRWSVRSRAWLLCPHTAETKIYPLAEADLRQDLPLTYAYLTRFRDILEARKGFAGWERAIQEHYFYALLRVGPYTFSRYKVAWRYIARSFITAVIAPMQDPYLGEALPLPNEKVIYVGTNCREEAYYLCGILSSAPVRCCVTCYMNPTSISAHVLDKLYIPAFDPTNSRHLSIAALCEEGHRASDPRCQDAVQQQLDRAVADLYSLTAADLDAVRAMLEAI